MYEFSYIQLTLLFFGPVRTDLYVEWGSVATISGTSFVFSTPANENSSGFDGQLITDRSSCYVEGA